MRFFLALSVYVERVWKRSSLTFPLDQNERVKVLENRWVEEEFQFQSFFFFVLKVIFCPSTWENLNVLCVCEGKYL